MPRKAFTADLQKAVDGVSVAGISDVRIGGDDGEFTFNCIAGGLELQISALTPDVSDYPSSHTYMLFAPDDAPANVAGALSDISDSAFGKPILQLLELVSRTLESTDGDGDRQMLNSQQYDDDEYDFDDDDDDDEVDEYFPDDDVTTKPFVGKQDAIISEGYTRPDDTFRQRIRSDLGIAKANGFKVGHLGGLMDGIGCYVSVSCRISKLGISEEAMQAWQVEPAEYLIVILQYPNGYKSMDSMKGYDAATARRHLNMRVGISSTYKPTMQEAVHAFTVLSKEAEKRREGSQTDSQSTHKGFRNSFISRPLNELLEERFPTLLNYRYNGMPWNGAEQFYNDHYGTRHEHADLGLQDQYLEPEHVSAAYPSIVMSDHIQDSSQQQHSLPLVGMQFVLRHFVRCTEFCLICFTKMPDDLQAIKPYVCEKPLCLYQYMSLGFGPSIEHEIMSQPKVVDLLISFCYASARMGRLKDFPSGLSLMIPPQAAYEKDYLDIQQPSGWNAWNTVPPQQQLTKPAVTAQKGTDISAVDARFKQATRELLFDKKDCKCPVRTGDWIIIRVDDNSARPLHCRVTETHLYPTIRVAEPVIPVTSNEQADKVQHVAKPAASTQNVFANEFRPASFHVYNQNFDDLDETRKREAIYALLDILPCVEDMKQYLLRKTQSPLSSWVDRLPPAVLGLLRWIIASNRACIVQVTEEEDVNSRKEDRVYGMSGWIQFRFAMGAPDKERRFIQAVSETTGRLKLKYPTLFAWHGSPLVNWHSIIREGLHFKDTAHGRAFGHGVYHSLEHATSLGYAGYGYGGTNIVWPKSELKINQALALNEIVNAPKEYVSSSPHLVVAQLDWIQTRYLFVKTTNVSNTNNNVQAVPIKEVKPVAFIEQDPNMTPKGSASERLVIPVNAISGSRRPRTAKSSTKRRKIASGTSYAEAIDIDADDDDGASVATLEEDLVIFRDEPSQASQTQADSLPTPNSMKGKSKAGGFLSKLVGTKSYKPLTDYVPNTLDYSKLPMLQQPAWATPGATKRLMRDFQELVKIQGSQPAHEVGWHIDEDAIDNMYQWIIELHSFDPTLPLAKDMKSKGFKSIVLELRFGKDYPMSPPFVRVIRPRFLGFQQGGGGHVTAGGAMCMQLLTNDGWSAVSSIESVLLQVRVAMSSLEPRPARLENGSRQDYGVGEAIEAYIRACAVHGWTVPAGFREMALGGDPNANQFY